ncbi:MAG: carbohydrate kinase family protein [Chloroflexota bacterium]
MFISVGITTMDIFVSGVTQIPSIGGDEFTVDSVAFPNFPFHLVLGGNGAISSYVWAKLGAETLLCSAIGQDTLGDIVYGWLTDAGVDTRGLVRFVDAATPATNVITDQQLNRLTFHHRGASLPYNINDFPPCALQNASALLLASATLFLDLRMDGYVTMAAQAKTAGIPVALDIGPAIGKPVTLDELVDILPNIDYFICNDHEIAVCTGQEESASGLRVAIQQILDSGTTCVIIKQGEAGATIQRVGGQPTHVPGFEVDARFTVGAGDSFNSGFLYALNQGMDDVSAVRFAHAVAALVVSGANGALGAPTLEEVNQLIVKQ